MKFIETYTGDFVNLDNVVRIGHESDNLSVYSYLYDIQGNKIDFLETPNHIADINGKDHKFESDEIVTLHRIVVEYITSRKDTFIELEDYDQHAWEEFMDFFNKFRATLKD